MPPLIISISGIRGIVGDGLGPADARRFAQAFGTYLGGAGRGVVLARDSRPSGPALAEAVRDGLRATGCHIADAGILSTPGAAVLVRHLGAAGGVVITASHNPLPWNGLKLLSARGQGLMRAEGERVLDIHRREAFAAAKPGRCEAVVGAAGVHVEKVLATVDAARIAALGLGVVVDPVNGAGGAEMRLLLERLGCRVTMIHGQPDGRFGRPPEPVPENLGDLSRAVVGAGAALGLALDPDADRLALVDETGRAIGEEYTLALTSRHRLTQARGPLAANLSTSRLMDVVAREAGVQLIRTPVGEVNVAEAIARHQCLIGGEGNGGVMDPRVALVRDALCGAALVLEMLAARGKKLSDLAGELPAYAMVKDKVPLGRAEPAVVLQAARRHFADARIDDRDGLHFSWETGWLHVRASNTEPILRVIAEADRRETAQEWVAAVKALAGG